MNVRSGDVSDLPRVLPLMRKHRALHESWDAAQFALRDDADQQFQRWLGPATEDPRTILIVAEEDDGRVIGYLAAVVERDLPIFRCDEYAAIRGMWVEPDTRRRGVAKAMVRRACEELSRLGLAQVRIRTAMPNAVGRKLLEGCGFREASVDLLMELPKAKKPPAHATASKSRKPH